MNNIVKHSGASEVFLGIKRKSKSIQIIIRDNGKGFDINDIHLTESVSGNGFGLMGIYERARILGTVPQIETSFGSGATIRLSIAV